MSALPASPCVGLCQLDPVTGFCTGCARTGAEIAAWRDAPDAFRAAVWVEIPARAAALGIATRRLPWDAETILGFIEASLGGGGVWSLGYGAAGVFPGGGCKVAREGDTLAAVSPAAALRLTIGPATRAFASAADGIVLGLPRVRLSPPVDRPTPLGPDAGAIRAADRGLPRFDLGLGRPEARLTLRAARPEETGPGAGPGARGAWVVETPLGRVERAGVDPDRDAPFPDLPGAYAPGAAFRP